MSQPTGRDWAIALGKGALGAVPFVGSLAVEVASVLIPNQRMERLEALVAELSGKLGDVPPDAIAERFKSAEYIDLLEEGMVQASRAVEPERITRIASLLKNSLTDAELRRLQDKRLLQLLGELSEAEVVLLHSYTLSARRDAAFRERHESVLRGPPAYIGAPQADLDNATMHEERRQHLVRLGLLRPAFQRWKRGELPEFDPNTGRPKASGHDLTSLGRLLLRRIDVISDRDR